MGEHFLKHSVVWHYCTAVHCLFPLFTCMFVTCDIKYQSINQISLARVQKLQSSRGSGRKWLDQPEHFDAHHKCLPECYQVTPSRALRKRMLRESITRRRRRYCSAGSQWRVGERFCRTPLDGGRHGPLSPARHCRLGWLNTPGCVQRYEWQELMTWSTANSQGPPPPAATFSVRHNC